MDRQDGDIAEGDRPIDAFGTGFERHGADIETGGVGGSDLGDSVVIRSRPDSFDFTDRTPLTVVRQRRAAPRARPRRPISSGQSPEKADDHQQGGAGGSENPGRRHSGDQGASAFGGPSGRCRIFWSRRRGNGRRCRFDDETIENGTDGPSQFLLKGFGRGAEVGAPGQQSQPSQGAVVDRSADAGRQDPYIVSLAQGMNVVGRHGGILIAPVGDDQYDPPVSHALRREVDRVVQHGGLSLRHDGGQGVEHGPAVGGFIDQPAGGIVEDDEPDGDLGRDRFETDGQGVVNDGDVRRRQGATAVDRDDERRLIGESRGRDDQQCAENEGSHDLSNYHKPASEGGVKNRFQRVSRARFLACRSASRA